MMLASQLSYDDLRNIEQALVMYNSLDILLVYQAFPS